MEVLIVIAIIIGVIYYFSEQKTKNSRNEQIKRINEVYNNSNAFEKRYAQLGSKRRLLRYDQIYEYEILNINPQEFVVFDCETTGLHPDQGDRIIEFCLLKYKNGKLVDKLNALVNPKMALSPKIESITGIKKIDLIGKPTIDHYIGDIIRFIDNEIVIGHNVIFDIEFLESEIERCNSLLKRDLNIRYIDTLNLARAVVYGVENYKLETLKKHFNIKTSSHRAYADCETTYEVYNKCLELLRKDR